MGPVWGSSIKSEFGNVKMGWCLKHDTLCMLPVKHTLLLSLFAFFRPCWNSGNAADGSAWRLW